MHPAVIISLQDVTCVLFEKDLKRPEGIDQVEFLLSKNVIVLTSNYNLNTAIEKFAIKDVGELPVVDFHNRRKVVGMIKRGDVMTACNRELLERRL